MREINIVGQVFGKLTVTAMLPGGKCRCDCSCGMVAFQSHRYSVRRGLTRSCGCLKHMAYHLTHGEAAKGKWTPEYRAWVNMITRCHNPNATRYSDWGGRGISVFAGWRSDYQAFVAYVGRRPSTEHSIDRFPNYNGNYEPGNIRWATRREQSLNQRSNRIVTVRGTTKTMTEWAECLGIKRGSLQWRLDNWTAEEALTRPVRMGGSLAAITV